MHDNVAALMRSNEAFNRGDLDGMLADYHPDIELRDLQHPPDSPEHMRGREAVLAYLTQWEEAFDEFTAEIEEYIDAGDAVVTVTHWRATGKDSGVAIDLRVADVFEFTDGKVVRATMSYADKDEALKAVGLEE